MLDGSYKISINSPMGIINGTITLVTNGNNVQGVIEVMGTKSNINGSKLSNDKCSFSGSLNTPLGNISYNATCSVLGDNLEIDVSTSYGNIKLNGKRF